MRKREIVADIVIAGLVAVGVTALIVLMSQVLAGGV